jgi:hypothetical protein
MNCNAEGCAKEAFAKGLCGTHYQRMRRKGTLEVRKTLMEIDPHGRDCKECGTYKSWDEFYKVRGKYFAQCKTCYKAYQKRLRDARRCQEGA